MSRLRSSGQTRVDHRSTEGDTHSAIFVGVQLTRRTGDRYRDVSDKLRDAVQQWLVKRKAPQHFATLVSEGGDLHADEQVLVFSESVLPGLKIA